MNYKDLWCPYLNKYIAYILIGILCTFVHVFLFYVLVDVFGLEIIQGNSLAFIAAFSCGHYLNHKYCFVSKSKFISTFWKYFIVAVSGLCLNTMIIYFLVHMNSYHKYIGLSVAIVCVPPFTYWANRVWTFKY